MTALHVIDPDTRIESYSTGMVLPTDPTRSISEFEDLEEGREYSVEGFHNLLSLVEPTNVRFYFYRERKNSKTRKPVETKVLAVAETQQVRRGDDPVALLRKQLADMRNVNENWDGLGASAPSDDAINGAAYLIDVWDRTSPASPEIGPLSDGGISFEIYGEDDRLLGAVDVFSPHCATYAFSISAPGDEFGKFDPHDRVQREAIFSLLAKAAQSA
jgi:hypothetical protein